jgi:feruloyl esterase
MEKLRDFAERAVHETALKGRALASAFYGSAPRRAYFNGCSTGGRQALTEAQRFADDFDGIVAGAPGNHTTRQAFGQVWIAQAAQRSDASKLPPAKLARLHEAVMAACDANDGVKDGVLEDPTRCTFDPSALSCAGSDTLSCLTPAQVLAVRQIYAGASHPRTGEPIFPGLERGSELAWGRWFGEQPADYATEFFKHIVFGNPAWDFRTLSFDGDLAAADEAGRMLDATDPDLGKFVGRGGKLLLYAGWSDPGIAPRNVVNYFQRVRAAVREAAGDSIRLFMVPGMEHCGGGNGTSTIDLLGTIDRWVESGRPPARIEASRLSNGVVDRTRPLCPYPQVATYLGSGSPDVADSFACR